VRILIYESPSLRCGFYEVFSDKTKIIFNGYAMIDVQKFNFACFLGGASLKICWSTRCVYPSWKVHTWIEICATLNHRKKTKADGSRLIPQKHTETLVPPNTVASSLTSSESSKYWYIGENHWNWTHLQPNNRLSQKHNEFIDVFTMVNQTSNRHIQAVMNNLKFIILDYLAAKKCGFWNDAEISATGP